MSSPEPFTYWKHKTKTGRIVYDRAKHSFTPEDVDRILRSLERQLEDDPDQPYTWVDLYIDLAKKIAARWIPDAFGEMLEVFIEGWRAYLKRVRVGYYGNFMEGYFGFCKQVFLNWKNFIGQFSIDPRVWFRQLKQLAGIMIEQENPDLILLEDQSGTTESF